MKKALSALLVVAVVLGFAAPFAFAAPPATATLGGTLVPASATLYLEPDPADASQASSIDVYLPASHTGCAADCLVYWDIMDVMGNNIVGYRPEGYLDPTPREDNWTFGDEFMTLFAREAGTVTVYAECTECDTYWTIEITIIPPEEVVVRPDGLLDILKSWWFDLKWTWDYQIHPFFKYIYFNACGWIVSAWNMFIASMCNFFSTLFA